VTGARLEQIVLDGGLCGWLAAIVLARHLEGTGIGVRVEEEPSHQAADALYAAGHDEVLPFLRQLGITERSLLAQCQAGYTLGVRVEGLHDMPLGGLGLDWEGTAFVSHLRHCRGLRSAVEVMRFSTGAVAMKEGRFAPLDQRNRIGTLQHGVGLHADPAKLRELFRDIATAAGVNRQERLGSGMLRILTKPLRGVEAVLGRGRSVPYTAVSSGFDKVDVCLAEETVLSIHNPQMACVDAPWDEVSLRIGPAAMVAPMEVFGPWRFFLRELSWLIDLLPPTVAAPAEAREYGRLFRAARDELTAMSRFLRGGEISEGVLFSKRGFLKPSDGQLFSPLDWTKAFLARDHVPRWTDPIAERAPKALIERELARLEANVSAVASAFPPYTQYLHAARQAAGART
jgi:hypothetical protein